MTQAETNRGRGKPRAYDEDELLARVTSIEDLVRVRDALDANGEGRTSRGAFGWLVAKWAGDPTGGVDRRSESVYRAALARLGDEDPLGTPNGRRRRRAQRGSAELVLVGAGAAVGALALAALTGPETLNFALSLVSRFAADNAPNGEVGGVDGLLRAA